MKAENKHFWNMKQHYYGDAGTFDIQTNPEWLAVRRGKFTASEAGDILSSSRNKDEVLGKTAKTVCRRVLTDRFTSFERPADKDAWALKDSVARGLQLEPRARELYEHQTGFEVKECGFVEHSSGWFGFSPDGIVEDENMGIEIKCPEPDNAQRLIDEVGDPDHLKQIAFAMWVDGLDCYDYVVYSPELCQGLELDDQVFIFSFSRDELQEYIDEIDKRAPILLEYINKSVLNLKKIGKKRQFIHARSK